MSENRFNTAEAREIEEAIYQRVAEEITSGVRRDGLWAKAIAETGGALESAKARYIQLRAQSILDEAEIYKKSKQEELQRQRADEERKRRKESEVQGADVKRQRAFKAGQAARAAISPLRKFFMWYVVISTGLGVVMIFPDLITGKFEAIPGALIIGGVFWWLLRKLREDS